MNNFYVPVLNDTNFEKITYTQEDMEKLVHRMYRLRNMVMAQTGIEISGFVLPADKFTLFKLAPQFLSKYQNLLFSEFKNLTFCGIPVYCGVTDDIIPMFKPEDSTGLIGRSFK
jgi:hypothetical protein